MRARPLFPGEAQAEREGTGLRSLGGWVGCPQRGPALLSWRGSWVVPPPSLCQPRVRWEVGVHGGPVVSRIPGEDEPHVCDFLQLCSGEQTPSFSQTCRGGLWEAAND